MEVKSCGGEQRVDAIVDDPSQIIPPHAVLGFDVPDHGLNCGPAFHLALDGGCGALDLAADPDAEFVRVIMTATALIDMNASNLDPGILFGVGDRARQRVTIERVAVQRLSVQHKLSAPGARHRGRD